jgi:hypothetical protein
VILKRFRGTDVAWEPLIRSSGQRNIVRGRAERRVPLLLETGPGASAQSKTGLQKRQKEEDSWQAANEDLSC